MSMIPLYAKIIYIIKVNKDDYIKLKFTSKPDFRISKSKFVQSSRTKVNGHLGQVACLTREICQWPGW